MENCECEPQNDSTDGSSGRNVWICLDGSEASRVVIQMLCDALQLQVSLKDICGQFMSNSNYFYWLVAEHHMCCTHCSSQLEYLAPDTKREAVSVLACSSPVWCRTSPVVIRRFIRAARCLAHCITAAWLIQSPGLRRSVAAAELSEKVEAVQSHNGE